jgi:hypothetical protein
MSELPEQSRKLSITVFVFVYALSLFVLVFHVSLLLAFERKTRQAKTECYCFSKGDWNKILLARIEITVVEVLEPMLLILGVNKRLLSALQRKWLFVLRTSSWSSFIVDDFDDDSLNDF